MFAPRAPDLMPIRDTKAKREPTPNARSISRDERTAEARRSALPRRSGSGVPTAT
jgi:hypothetical protein